MRSSRAWMRSSKSCGWDLAELWISSSREWMRSSRVCGRDLAEWLDRLTANAVPGFDFDPSILRHNGIWRAADEAVLNIVHKKKKIHKNSPFYKISARILSEDTWSRRRIELSRRQCKMSSSKKIDLQKGQCGRCLSVWGPEPHSLRKKAKVSTPCTDLTGPQYIRVTKKISDIPVKHFTIQ